MKGNKTLLILMLIAMLIWGMSWSSAKVLSAYGSPMSITYIRFFLVPITLFPLLKIAKIKITLVKKGILPVLAAGILMIFYTTLFFTGLKTGMPGAGGVLVTTTIPIFTFIISLIIVKKLPSKQSMFGLLLGLIAGLILLKVWGSGSQIFDSGNSLFLLAAVVYAAMSKFTSISGSFGHPVSFNFWLHLIAISILSCFVDLLEVKAILMNGDLKFWLNMLYFGIINSALATTTYFFATSKLGADKASSFMFIVPAAALLFSWLILDEAVQWNTITGGVLAIFAVYIINRKAIV